MNEIVVILAILLVLWLILKAAKIAIKTAFFLGLLVVIGVGVYFFVLR